jgi:hypothetical protein
LIVNLLAAALLTAGFLAPQASTSLPWVFPGDFRERLGISGLVVSGTIEKTLQTGTRKVDGTEVTAHVADVRIDRVFQGSAAGTELQFAWFTPGGTGYVWDGPPLADFRPGRRYLVFLKKGSAGWQVSMPLYAVEVELAATPPSGSLPDLSKAPLRQRYEALAEEMEDAALYRPVAPDGVMTQTSDYFPPVFDLLAGCAGQFYRRFLASPDPELRDAASKWLDLIRSRHLACKEPSARLPR